jgi:hypothetical protein
VLHTGGRDPPEVPDGHLHPAGIGGNGDIYIVNADGSGLKALGVGDLPGRENRWRRFR